MYPNVWTKISSTGPNIGISQNVFAGGGLLVAWYNVWYAISSDGISWQNYNSPNNNTIFSFSYANGKFWMVNGDSKIRSSEDAVSWTEHSFPAGFSVGHQASPIVYFKGKYYFISSGYVASSADGETWARSAESLVKTYSSSVSRIFLGATEDYMLYTGYANSAEVEISMDGEIWSMLDDRLTMHPTEICAFKDSFLIGDSANVAGFPNIRVANKEGVTSPGVIYPVENLTVSAMATSEDLIVLSLGNFMEFSTDTTTWRTVLSPNGPNTDTVLVGELVYLGNKFYNIRPNDVFSIEI